MGDSRCVKRLFTVFLGWIVGGTLAFSQLLPTPIYQKATYFSLEDVRLLESPFLDLQQKGKEYLLWLILFFIFIGLKRDYNPKQELMPVGNRRMFGEPGLCEVAF